MSQYTGASRVSVPLANRVVLQKWKSAVAARWRPDHSKSTLLIDRFEVFVKRGPLHKTLLDDVIGSIQVGGRPIHQVVASFAVRGQHAKVLLLPLIADLLKTGPAQAQALERLGVPLDDELVNYRKSDGLPDNQRQS